jgi:gamma-glutamylcyclotransferase (GGCT)/AIG2-like uncharacterized protein YtfP
MTVFVYGTLRDPSILNAVLGHDRVLSVKGWADGYAARLAYGHPFPMLRPMADSSAEGLLLLNLDEADIAALDSFEGETYQRQAIMIRSENGKEYADIYIDDGSYSDGGVFILSEWKMSHRDKFITSFAGYKSLE